MKLPVFAATAPLFAALLIIPLPAPGQGALTPAQPPGATFKTLDQIEPRVDVLSLPGDGTAIKIISAPGSYYLSGNLVGFPGRAGIAIASPDVTLDLRGFAVIGTGVGGGPGTTANGIEIRAGATGNVIVRNGGVRAWGLAGIDAVAGLRGVAVEDVSISGCGTAGIRGLSHLTVRRCQVANCAGDGIQLNFYGLVQDSTVDQCSSSAPVKGICANQVSRCRVSNAQSVAGLSGIYGELVTESSAQNISSSGGPASGIVGSTVTDCIVQVVDAAAGSEAKGIVATAVTNCSVTYVGNNSAGAPTGIAATTVARCAVLSVGGTSTAGPVRGIDAAAISGSSVGGLSAPNQSVTGILAGASVGGGSVTDCTVYALFTGAAPLRGISSLVASHCRVSLLTQSGNGAALDGYVAGIEAERIADCQVSQINGASATVARGLSGFRSAQGCSVNAVTDSVGQARGLSTTLPALVEQCTVTGGKNGIYLTGNGSQVRNCSITSLTATGAENGAAIYVSASTCRIEGCTISGANFGVFFVSGSNHAVDGNSFSALGTAVFAAAPKAVVTRNRIASGVSLGDQASPNLLLGPIVTGSGILASSNPWANFAD